VCFVGWVELLRNPSFVVVAENLMGFAYRSTHPADSTMASGNREFLEAHSVGPAKRIFDGPSREASSRASRETQQPNVLSCSRGPNPRQVSKGTRTAAAPYGITHT
jgi:hypothetical protein